MAWRIKTVVERTGVRPETLRSWERRYGLVDPQRSPGGYRLYSDSDLAAIARVKALTDGGLAASEAVQRAREEGLASASAPEDGPPETGVAELRSPRQGLLGALLDLDEAAAVDVIAGAILLPMDRLVHDLLLPVHRELRWLHAQGRASGAQAAFAGGWIGDRLGALRVALGPGRGAEPLAIALGAPGGVDPVAVQALALGLRLGGWRTLLLGAAVPLVDLAPVLRRNPSLLALQLPDDPPRTELLALRARLRALAPPGCRVVLVGEAAEAGADVLAARGASDLPGPGAP